MTAYRSRVGFFAVAGSFLVSVAATNLCADHCVKFDVTSIAECCDVSDEAFAMANPDERLIEIHLPVSTLVDCDKGISVSQLMIYVRGLSTQFPVVDYLPGTQLQSPIDGPIAIEKVQGTNLTLGLDAGANYNQTVNLNATAKTGKQNSTTERFQKIPDQQLLLASGTIDRGAGVYYKFRHSNQTTLEGSHSLVITLRVPLSWRGGLMRVDCLATGEEKYLLGTDEEYIAGKQSFMVALYLKGDQGARDLAHRYVQLETALKNYGLAWMKKQAESRNDLVSQLGSLLGHRHQNVSADWVYRISLFDQEQFQATVRPQLSGRMQSVADQYLTARQQLRQLNR